MAYTPASFLSGGQQRAAQQTFTGVMPSLVSNDYSSNWMANTPSSAVSEAAQSTTLRHGAPVVHLATDRRGLRWVFANGARRQNLSPVGWPGDASGQVAPTLSQPFANTRVGMALNDWVHRSGLPLNLGLSFKVPYSYYPANSGMIPATQLTGVQRVGRSSGAPNAYNTTSGGA